MMKNLLKLSFVFGLFCSQNIHSQIVIPHPIPCIDINPVSVDTFPSGISAHDCIEVDGETVDFKTDQHYSIKAGEYIQFDNNTVIEPDETHLFHAYIQTEDMDLAWYYPNATPGTVGQYEKLEIGVQLNESINDKIENFVNREIGGKLNPFDPYEVDVYAEFWYLFEDEWLGPVRANGFFYQEYTRETVDWDTVLIAHNFRVRYAPSTIGTYRCRITADIGGVGIQNASDFTFEVVPSSNKGFVHVGENKRYFKEGNEPFYPIGHNLFGPERETGYQNQTVHPSSYIDFLEAMQEFADEGGNYFRYIQCPWQTEIEYEYLGDYSNRMTNAWEFDNILDTAHILDLKIHFNMAIHYTFQTPDAAFFYWDWSAAGDTLNRPITYEGSGCFRASDSLGYCYRNLGLPLPEAFFSSTEALVYYKRRIRYMMARWSYSTNIAVVELLSEASHCGIAKELELRVPPEVEPEDAGCYTIDSYHPYSENVEFPDILEEWHKSIADYMKYTLDWQKHPIAVNYPGEPNKGDGDNSYGISSVDINTYNHYSLTIKNPYSTYHTVTEKYQKPSHDWYSDKPFMNSEYGTGKPTSDCDHNAGFIRRICLTPFTGLAGTAMTWHSNRNEMDGWQYYEHVNALMEGIPLDAENWRAGEPMVQNDESVEVLYLRKGELGENTKIVGAVANRTFNYYTQGEDGTDCKVIPDEGELPENPIYQSEQSYEITDLNQNFKFKNMGAFKGYQIEWINALTGATIDTMEKISDISGHLKLEYPGTLTGNSIAPILFFKLYRIDATFLVQITPSEIETKLPEEFKEVDDLNLIEATSWIDSSSYIKPLILISPNPTMGIVNCLTRGDYSNLSWVLTNSNGQYLNKNSIAAPNFTIDLSVYNSGNYYLQIQNKQGEILQTLKLIKL
ncbi:MAG: T9SS type A sorting domain-containing protein [Crocinitomix sp.]|nr:T9SS type A sorting domain-containing protein [Crocinitomix sp.]